MIIRLFDNLGGGTLTSEKSVPGPHEFRRGIPSTQIMKN